MSLPMLNEASFDEWLGGSGVAVLEFGAVWCPPCRALLPMLDELAEEYGASVAIAKTDADDSPELASRYGVMSLPTVIVFKDGQPADKLVGLRPKAVYRTVIDRCAAAGA